MVTLLVIAIVWLIGAVITGVGVGRMIARAEFDSETAELERQHRGVLTLR